jgi:hypothetical protein
VLIALDTTSMGMRRRSLPGGRPPRCRENSGTVQASPLFPARTAISIDTLIVAV